MSTSPVNNYVPPILSLPAYPSPRNREISLFAISLIALSGVAIVSYLAISGAVSVPVVTIISLTGSCLATRSFLKRAQSGTYQDVGELKRFQSKAFQMTLQQAVQTYGWNSLLRQKILSPEILAEKYRQHLQKKSIREIIKIYEDTTRQVELCPTPKMHFEVPPPRQWAKQWHVETAKKTFKEIIDTYDLEALKSYGILQIEEFQYLKKLQKDHAELLSPYNQKRAAVQQAFAKKTAPQRGAYQKKCREIDQAYNNDATVRRLRAFEFTYTKEREQIQKKQEETVAKARQKFEAESTLLRTKRGQAARGALNALKKIFTKTQSQAEALASREIQALDKRRHATLSQLTLEEKRIKEMHTTASKKAEHVYTTSIASEERWKQKCLGPSEQTYRSALGDLDGRYKAYLRTIGVQ